MVGLGAELGEVAADIAVVIPAADAHLYEADAGFAELTGEEAGTAELVGVLAAHAVEVEGRLGFLGEVDDLRGGRLHAEGQFHALDHAFHAFIADDIALQLAIHPLDEVEALALDGIAFGDVTKVFDRQALGARRYGQAGALVSGREERIVVGPDALGVDGDEAGEILVLGAEAVTDPGAHRRADFGEGARVELLGSAGVLRIIRVHPAEEADVVRDGREVRE